MMSSGLHVLTKRAVTFRIAVVVEFVNHDGARAIQRFDVFEQQSQQLKLAEALVGEGERMPKRKSGIHRTRRLDLPADAT
jgi:hypothetical protein